MVPKTQTLRHNHYKSDGQPCATRSADACRDVLRGAHAQRRKNRNAAHALDRHEEKPTGPVHGCDHAPAMLAAPLGSSPLGVKSLGHEKDGEVREEALCVGTERRPVATGMASAGQVLPNTGSKLYT